MAIDWLNVLYNACWLIGLALVLAAFSYNDWLAAQTGVKLRQQLDTLAFQLPLSIGLALVSLSLALLADVWWEQVIWAAFLVIFGVQAWQSRKKST